MAAPTGVAAINAGGVTLHSLFQLPFHPFFQKNNKEELLGKLRQNRQKLQLLRKMEMLVIDEISMVRCDTMDAIDTILRSVRAAITMFRLAVCIIGHWRFVSVTTCGTKPWSGIF